jgi:uncharacterized membrane protein YvlD (DUF360 family)
MNDIGRLVLTVGVFMILVGGALMLFGRLHLPGDLTIRRGGFTIYAPLATSLILSVVLTLLLNLLLRAR